MKKSLNTILRILARLTLARYKPRVVAITGSVGKTSTKEAVACVLSSKFFVRATPENYNNEIGVPLAIIGEKSAEKNILLWLIIFLKAVLKLVYIKYPQILVLEIGTDKPGDIGYLTDLIGNIDVAIITDIGISHLQFFTTQQELSKEKLSVIKKLGRDKAAILNFDNPKVFDGKTQTKAEVFGYGFSDQANFLISDFQIIKAQDSTGANFKLHYQGGVVPFYIPNALARPLAYAAAAAAATGVRFGIDLASASEAIRELVPPPGRLRLIAGIKHTQIIDDTYNSAPDSVSAGLEAVSNIAKSRKLAAFGDMAELGSKTGSAHREVAAKIMEANIDTVFLVGQNSKITHSELKKKKFTGKIFWFENSDQARIPVQNELQEGDTILVKGSQSTRMEKIVKEIIAEPMSASKLLVRQTSKWIKS